MMKLKFYALLLLSTVVTFSCSKYDDSGLQQQITEVTDQVKALQVLTEALQNHDYIVSVTPTTVDGANGYVITFAKANPITILNGGGKIKEVDNTHDGYVTFTLADGTTKITLPRAGAISIGFESYDTFYCSETDNEITLILPSTLKESDYKAIVATVANEYGTGQDIHARSVTTENTWGVKVIKPSFTEGVLVANSAKVMLTLPKNKTNYKALLKVTIIDSKGNEFSVNRIVWFKADKDINVVDNTTGDLSAKITDPASVKQLSVIGSVSDNDFKYIRENLTSIEVLDLSRTSLASLPSKALAFYSSMGLAGNTSLKTIILPESLTEIGNSAFAMCMNLREISISKSVRTLGGWMFEGCSVLEEVKLPHGIVEIPASAFYGAGIKTITLPSSVTSIGAWAFDNCKRLESANIPSGVTVINDGVFYMCENLQHIEWHDNITSIGSDAFCICKKLYSGESLVLPSKVTSIGARAFSFTGATSVQLPEGVQTIGGAAFSNCPIDTIDIPATITSLHATAFSWSAATTVICRSAVPPTIPLLDDNNNEFPPFYEINPSCVLKKPISSDYSAWNSYFGGGIQDL